MRCINQIIAASAAVCMVPTPTNAAFYAGKCGCVPQNVISIQVRIVCLDATKMSAHACVHWTRHIKGVRRLFKCGLCALDVTRKSVAVVCMVATPTNAAFYAGKCGCVHGRDTHAKCEFYSSATRVFGRDTHSATCVLGSDTQKRVISLVCIGRDTQ